MIGSGLKKLAQANGMRIDAGVGYGSLRGFATTLSEGAGWKRIDVTTTFPEGAAEQLQVQIGQVDVTRQFRVQNIMLGSQHIGVIFTDNPGTMAKIEAFIEWFYPLLEQVGATGVKVCTQCGFEAEVGCWKLIGGVAWYFHEACAQKILRELDYQQEQERSEDTGTYGRGLLGAFLGALLGAVVWALLLMAGYLAVLAGFLIGWLADKGYTLLKGKKGKGKVIILILAILFGVLVGTVGGEILGVMRVIGEGGTGFTVGQAPSVFFALLLVDPEVQAGVGKNILMGLFFAAIGVISLLVKAGKEVADTKVVDLK